RRFSSWGSFGRVRLSGLAPPPAPTLAPVARHLVEHCRPPHVYGPGPAPTCTRDSVARDCRDWVRRPRPTWPGVTGERTTRVGESAEYGGPRRRECAGSPGT